MVVNGLHYVYLFQKINIQRKTAAQKWTLCAVAGVNSTKSAWVVRARCDTVPHPEQRGANCKLTVSQAAAECVNMPAITSDLITNAGTKHLCSSGNRDLWFAYERGKRRVVLSSSNKAASSLSLWDCWSRHFCAVNCVHGLDNYLLVYVARVDAIVRVLKRKTAAFRKSFRRTNCSISRITTLCQ